MSAKTYPFVSTLNDYIVRTAFNDIEIEDLTVNGTLVAASTGTFGGTLSSKNILQIVPETAASNCSLFIGQGRTGDGVCYLSFKSDNSGGNSALITRAAGANGQLLINNHGDGALQIKATGATAVCTIGGGNTAQISMNGTDVSIPSSTLKLTTIEELGSAGVTIEGVKCKDRRLYLVNGAGDTVSLFAPSSITGGNLNFQYPGDLGSANQSLVTNGAGVLSWAEPTIENVSYTNPSYVLVTAQTVSTSLVATSAEVTIAEAGSYFLMFSSYIYADALGDAIIELFKVVGAVETPIPYTQRIATISAASVNVPIATNGIYSLAAGDKVIVYIKTSGAQVTMVTSSLDAIRIS